MNLLQIKEALTLGSRSRGLLFEEGRRPEKWEEIRAHPYYREMVQELYDLGKLYSQAPLRSLRFSDYRVFDTTGSRKPYDQEYFEHRGRLKTFALLSMIEGDDKYVRELEDTIWAICDEYTWCMPAGMEGESLTVAGAKDGFIRNESLHYNFVRDHESLIELFAAETGFALAEICSLLEEKLHPLVVHRARSRIKERIIRPYCEIGGPLFWWETTTINWAAVCAGSVGAAALYLCEEGEVLAPILRRVIDTMECFISGYEEDGACTEGIGYWNYGFGFYVYFAELLRQRTENRIDLMQGDKIRQIALFQQKCYLTDNKVVSFSDAPRQANFHPGLTHRLMSFFEEVETPDSRYRMKLTDDHAHRWAHGIRNFVWSDPVKGQSSWSEASYYLKDARWIVSRTETGGNQVCFAAKGGHNGEPHNHNDVGSFLFHANGESLLTDFGMGEYTKAYFGPERYNIFCNGSQGHSVPIIDGIFQKAGREFGDRDPQAILTKEKDSFVLDLAGAYPIAYLTGLRRRFEFDKEGAARLILTDSYSFTKTPSEVIERFVSFRRPEIAEAGTAIIRGSSGAIAVRCDPEALECKVSSGIFHNHQAVAMDVYVLDLKVRNLLPEFTVKVTFDLV